MPINILLFIHLSGIFLNSNTKTARKFGVWRRKKEMINALEIDNTVPCLTVMIPQLFMTTISTFLAEVFLK